MSDRHMLRLMKTMKFNAVYNQYIKISNQAKSNLTGNELKMFREREK